MSVFDDPNKELEALQAQLQEQEDWFQRELDSAKRMIGDMPEPRKPQASATPAASVAGDTVPVRNYANGYGTQAPQKRLKQEENFDRDEFTPKKKGLGGLLILAALETLGILGIAGYWLVYLLG